MSDVGDERRVSLFPPLLRIVGSHLVTFLSSLPRHSSLRTPPFPSLPSPFTLRPIRREAGPPGRRSDGVKG